MAGRMPARSPSSPRLRAVRAAAHRRPLCPKIREGRDAPLIYAIAASAVPDPRRELTEGEIAGLIAHLSGLLGVVVLEPVVTIVRETGAMRLQVGLEVDAASSISWRASIPQRRHPVRVFHIGLYL